MTVFWTAFASIAFIAILVGLSVNAILSRREPGTTVAWIGLIWLSPILGPILYLILGINRVGRRAKQLRSKDHLSIFERRSRIEFKRKVLREALGPESEHLVQISNISYELTNIPLTKSNRIEVLQDGEEAFPAMLAAIESATMSINLQSYIFDDDRAGRRFVEALVDAQKRGVIVRVLIDDVGARYSFPAITRQLRREGIRVALFLPAIFHWRMPYFNLRNHRKQLIVDGDVGFTGGLNIREQYWREIVEEDKGHDLHFKLTGPIVEEMQDIFVNDWHFTTKEKLLGQRWYPEIEPAGDTIARSIPDGPNTDKEVLHRVILGALAAARDRVVIVTPYFIPDQRLQSALITTSLRGVDVTLILPEVGNLALVQWASTASWEELLDNKCRIVLTPPPFDHTKLMIVDDAWSFFGSANMDTRSLRLNFEANIESYDHELVARLDELINDKLAIGREINQSYLEARPYLYRLRDGLARLLSPYL